MQLDATQMQAFIAEICLWRRHDKYEYKTLTSVAFILRAKGDTPLKPRRPAGAGMPKAGRKLRYDASGSLAMVRPRKSEQALTEPFSFRLSEAEARVLREKVERSNLTQAEFIRECVLTNRTTIVARVDSSLEKRRMQFILNRSNNYLTQIAGVIRAASPDDKLSEDFFLELLSTLCNIAKYLKAALNHVD